MLKRPASKQTKGSAGKKKGTEGNETPKEENEELRKMQQQHDKLKEENEELRKTQQQHDKLKEEIEELRKTQQQHDKLKEEIEELRKTQQQHDKLKEENEELRKMQQQHDKLKEEIEELRKIQQQHDKLKEENEELRKIQQQHEKLKGPNGTDKKYHDLEEKYEKLLSHMLSRDTEGQEPLNDPCRPSQVAVRWRTFKDQFYFNAYHRLYEKLNDKVKCRKHLTDLCQVIFEDLRKKEDTFEVEFKNLLTPIFQGKDAEGDLKKAFGKVMGAMKKSAIFKISPKEMNEVQEEVLDVYRGSRTFLADMQTKVLVLIKNRWKKAENPETPVIKVKELFQKRPDLHQHTDICENYVTECHAICRLLLMQVPRMHLSFDAGQKSKFNTGHFDVHDGPNSGDLTPDQLVLPALLRSAGGKVMEKGLATVKQ